MIDLFPHYMAMFICLAIILVTFAVCYIYYCIKKIGYQGSAYQLNTHKPFSKVIFNKGYYGEYLVYKYLKNISPPRYFLFNVYLPKDNGETTEIDALLIHQSGIYVFESKNYSGWIFGTESQQQWTQTIPNGRSSQKNHFLNPIVQNELHIKWLKSVLSKYTNATFHSYVLFSDRCTLKNVTLTTGKAQVMNRYRVFASVSKQVKQLGAIISQSEMEEIYDTLYPYSQTTDELKQKHVNDINVHHPGTSNVEGDVSSDAFDTHTSTNNSRLQAEPLNPGPQKLCPKCGKTMVLRTAKKGANVGDQFWGCSGYPHCRYIENGVAEGTDSKEGL